MKRRFKSCLFAATLLAIMTTSFETRALDAGPEVIAEMDAGAATQDENAPKQAEPLKNPAEVDPIGTAGTLYSKVKAGEWLPALGLAMFFLVWLLRFLGGLLSEWFTTKRGGYVVALVSALLVTLGMSLSAGEPIGIGMMVSALSLAWVSAGGRKALADAWGVLRKPPSE